MPRERGSLPQAQHVLPPALQQPPVPASQLTTTTLIPPTLPCLSQMPHLSARSVPQQQAVLSALVSPKGPGKGLYLTPLPCVGKQLFYETPHRMAALSSHLATSWAPRRQSSALAKSVGTRTGARRSSSWLSKQDPLCESTYCKLLMGGGGGGKRQLPCPPGYNSYSGLGSSLLCRVHGEPGEGTPLFGHTCPAAQPLEPRQNGGTLCSDLSQQHGCLPPTFHAETNEEQTPDVFPHYQLYQVLVHLSGWV